MTAFPVRFRRILKRLADQRARVPVTHPHPGNVSLVLGHQRGVAAGPEGANMGLGCGNPLAIAALRQGKSLLDPGSAGGFDCILAARAVGETERVIGVHMTPEIVSKARANTAKTEFRNIKFRLGEIEHLPVADCWIDGFIWNRVTHLSPEQPKMFDETILVLSRGTSCRVRSCGNGGAS
ncbi:MAG: methyltransferase domain-containing protein [Thermoanaerobaculaceae bacterium]